MGNPDLGDCLSALQKDVLIKRFYTSNAWIEGRAEDQLSHVSAWNGVLKIAAFPDLHPGKNVGKLEPTAYCRTCSERIAL